MTKIKNIKHFLMGISRNVIPTKVGIQKTLKTLDSGFRRNDEYRIFRSAPILFFFLLLPSVAWAWGPATHLDLALTVLANLSWATPAVAALLRAHSDAFIYGSVSPDIIVGKKYAGAIYHCHNWEVASVILKEAKTDVEKAAAYGYLCHLAADTVAHNYFVPFKIIRSFNTRMLSHTYWEMRFDLDVPEEVWKVVKKVVRHDYHEFDYLLERVLKRTLFSFRTNKRIFNSILILQKLKQLRFTLKTYAKASRWTLEHEKRSHYRQLALDSIRDFLQNGDQARCMKADPSGLRKLTYAMQIRRRLKEMETSPLKLRGESKGGYTDTFVAEVKEKLREGLFDPNVTLPTI